MSGVSGAWTIARYAVHESIRRRIFHIVLLLSAGFLALYYLGTREVFEEVETFPPEGIPINAKVLAGSTVFGLSMFGTLFLGTVLAIFFTLGVVRGDAERGLLQPLVVRPVGRSTLLVARFVAAASVSAAYVLALYTGSLLITQATGGWWPDSVVMPALQLAAGVVVICALSLLGSVFLSGPANGIAVFMLYGAGLVAGLLGQIGEALDSESLQTVAERVAWALPFEALYLDALHALTADTAGFTRFAVQLGPFGGAQPAGGMLWPWVTAYLLIVGGLALVAFARRDL